MKSKAVKQAKTVRIRVSFEYDCPDFDSIGAEQDMLTDVLIEDKIRRWFYVEKGKRGKR